MNPGCSLDRGREKTSGLFLTWLRGERLSGGNWTPCVSGAFGPVAAMGGPARDPFQKASEFIVRWDFPTVLR